MSLRIPMVLLALMAAVCSPALGQNTDEAVEPAQEKTAPAAEAPSAISQAIAEVKAAVESYVAAFNAGEVEKLVSLWSPDGVYISRSSGERISGREAMTKEFTAILSAEDPPKLTVATETIELISPSVALERGTAVLSRAQQTEETNYTAVYIQRDGKWLIDRVTEKEIIAPQSNYSHLSELDWLVGSWIDDHEGVRIEIDCRWTENGNFIARTYSVATADGVESSGLQIIGWDAQNKQIRSWLFDSNGGLINGTWNRNDDGWVVQSLATLADGTTGSFTSVFQPTDDGNYTWKKINRVRDGKLLPNLDEVLVVRR